MKTDLKHEDAYVIMGGMCKAYNNVISNSVEKRHLRSSEVVAMIILKLVLRNTISG
jgi:hypothetical protein